MKYSIYPLVLLLAACATPTQKEEIRLLKAMQSAERKVDRGKFFSELGKEITLSGEMVILEGSQEKKVARDALIESLGETK